MCGSTTCRTRPAYQTRFSGGPEGRALGAQLDPSRPALRAAAKPVSANRELLLIPVATTAATAAAATAAAAAVTTTASSAATTAAVTTAATTTTAATGSLFARAGFVYR